MSVKIFVSSTSTINLIDHPDNIIVIPDVIRYSDIEEYQDGLDIDTNIFYNRLRYDDTKLDIIPPSKEIIFELFKSHAKKDDEIILILPASGVIYFDDDTILELQDTYKNLVIFNSILFGYPLAKLILDLNSNIESGMQIEDALAIMEKTEENSEIIFYCPNEDVMSISQFEKTLKKKKTADKFYVLNFSSLIEIKKKDFDEVDDILRYIIKKTEGIDVIPFIMYTNELSYYIDYLEKKILNVYTLKTVKKVIIPPAAGIVLGPNAFGIGYIKLDDTRRK